MSFKHNKAIILFIPILIIPILFGACKFGSKSTTKIEKGTGIKAVKPNIPTATRGVSSTNKTNTTSNKNNTTANQNQNADDSLDFTESPIHAYDYTTPSEMAQLLNNEPMDEVPITNIDHNLDLNGRTIKIVYDTDINRSPGDPPSLTELAQNPSSIIRYNIIEDAKKKMNFNIYWIYRSHDNIVYEYMETIAAGKKYADIILTSTKRVFPILATKKLLVPMDNFINFDNDPIYNIGTMATGTEFLGRRWGFAKDPYNLGYVFFYNRDIFAKEGLTDLQILYDQGLWAWDTMVNYAKSATHDYNGDGKIDQWGLLISHPHYAVQALILSNGGDMIRYDPTENTYKFAANDEKVVRALQLVSDMISAKITTPDSSVKFDKFPSAMVIGKIAADGQAYKKLGMNFGIVPLPKGPDVSTTQFASASGTDAYFIPVNTDPKVSAAVIIEAFTYWDYNKPQYMTKEEIMSANLQKYLCTDEDVKWSIRNFESPRISQIMSFETLYANFNKEIFQRIAYREITAPAALEIFEQSLQQDIDNALNN